MAVGKALWSALGKHAGLEGAIGDAAQNDDVRVEFCLSLQQDLECPLLRREQLSAALHSATFVSYEIAVGHRFARLN